MQIQLCEDDGLFHGGVPQIVVLMVKFDDGKTKRIPYPADKTISALYQDLNAIAPVVAESVPEIIEDIVIMGGLEGKPKKHIATFTNRPVEEKTLVGKSNTIEKEDIVTIVKLHERKDNFSGTESPLMIGMDYRVIKVMGPTIPTPDGKGVKKVVQGYEIIDDTAPTPERMIVYPDEVQLKNKRLSQVIKKVQAIEEMLPCPSCRTMNSLTLDGTDFKGNCEACGVDIDIGRMIKKCPSVGCGQEVSCFDVGGKYEGLCGKCKSNIEVPYA